MERRRRRCGESGSDFTKQVTPLVRNRAQDLLLAVLRDLLDRGRKVRVQISTNAWERPVSPWLGRQWGKLTATVDGVQVCFDWIPVRDKDNRDTAQDRLRIRWSHERDCTLSRGEWSPSTDCVSLIEPKESDLDPRKVAEAFESWLVDRKRANREARERREATERLANLQASLSKEAQAAIPTIGAAEARVACREDGVRVSVTWNVPSASDARALLDSLAERRVAAAFTVE